MNKINTKYGKGTICVEGTRQINELWHDVDRKRVKRKQYNIDLDPAYLRLWYTDDQIAEIISAGSLEKWEKSKGGA